MLKAFAFPVLLLGFSIAPVALHSASAQSVLFTSQSPATADLPAVGSVSSVKTDVGTEESGLVLYRANLSGHSVIALATDTGSARPTQDFRLYFQVLGGYHLALSIPSMTGRAFRCEEAEGVLRVFLVTKYEPTEKPSPPPKTALTYEQPFLIIDLPELIKAFQ
jgi:hypothetical protein